MTKDIRAELFMEAIGAPSWIETDIDADNVYLVGRHQSIISTHEAKELHIIMVETIKWIC
jgi:hypothetical protein